MLTITLPGTAATMPLPDRALTAAVAECGGHSSVMVSIKFLRITKNLDGYSVPHSSARHNRTAAP